MHNTHNPIHKFKKKKKKIWSGDQFSEPISDGADLKVQSNSGAGHQSVEMLTEFFREDVLRECLIGIKCLLLYTTDTYIDISNSTLMFSWSCDDLSHLWTFTSVYDFICTSARSSKQLPTRGCGLPSAVISTASSIRPNSLTVNSWTSRILLNASSTSYTHHRERENWE